nr:EOG090X072S [Macrothrix elegans]
MQSPEDRNYPVTVCVVASAKVSDLIGLVCYKYNNEKRQPPLSGPVENYALFIAEDDGSPDADFPCLEPKEVVSKFGFTTLALVRVANHARETKPEAEMIKSIEHPSTETKPEERTTVLESTDYHSFKGYLLHKVRPKTEITLVTTLLWSRPNLKPTQLRMEIIVDCIDMQTVPPSVGIIYYHPDKRKWRRLRIECDSRTIDQVTAKLKFILEIRGGVYRQEYLHHVTSPGKRASLTR